MKLTIVAATGGIGQHLVHQAMAAGHDVTAAVRTPAKLDAAVPATVVDLSDPDEAALRRAVQGADAVLSGLGPRSRADIGMVSRATRAIASAMQAGDVRRLVFVSGVGIGTVPRPGHPNPPKREPGAGLLVNYLTTPLARRVLGTHMADLAMTEDLLADTELQWTSVRVPYLTDAPLTGVYRTGYGTRVRRGLRLGRADAAHFMLAALDHPASIRQAVSVAY